MWTINVNQVKNMRIYGFFFLCMCVFFSTHAIVLYAQSDVLTIPIPESVQNTHEYALEIEYTYMPPFDTGETMGVRTDRSSYEDTATDAMPNFFSLTLNTNSHIYNYTITMQYGTHSIYIYPFMIEGILQSMDIEANKDLQDMFGGTQNALSIIMSAYNINTLKKKFDGALPVSIQDMISWKGSQYTAFQNGDADVFRWSTHTYAVVMLFASKAVQAKYLKRIALFVEKKGTRGTMVPTTALARYTGWGAHDYKADDLALFFETARTQHIALLPEEYALKQLFITLGILVASNASGDTSIENMPVTTGTGTISTVARSYTIALQKILLTHELMHAWFFENKSLRKYVHAVWQEASKNTQEYWKRFLSMLRYDDQFEYLVENELFAYLLQRPLDALYTHVPAWFRGYSASDSENAQVLQEMHIMAEKLNRYIQHRYNGQAGFIQNITRY